MAAIEQIATQLETQLQRQQSWQKPAESGDRASRADSTSFPPSSCSNPSSVDVKGLRKALLPESALSPGERRNLLNSFRSFWIDLREWYVLYRSLLGRGFALGYVTMLWASMLHDCRPTYVYFFAYLTNWGLTLCVVYFFCGLMQDFRKRWRDNLLFQRSVSRSASSPASPAAKESSHSSVIPAAVSSTTLDNDCPGSDSSPLPSSPSASSPFRTRSFYYTCYNPSFSISSLWWKLFLQSLGELTFVVQVVIVFFFWVVVFPQEPQRSIWWEIQTHGMGLSLMLLDYAYNKLHRFSLRNHKWILLFGVTYLFCHVCVVLFSGEPIYPGIHFRDLRSILITMSALSALVITHKMVYLYSNWDRIQFEVQSFFRLIYLVILGVETLEVSPLMALWDMLTTSTDWTKHPYYTTSTGRHRKLLSYIYGGFSPSHYNRVVRGYTGKWASSRSASIGSSRPFGKATAIEPSLADSSGRLRRAKSTSDYGNSLTLDDSESSKADFVLAQGRCKDVTKQHVTILEPHRPNAGLNRDGEDRRGERANIMECALITSNEYSFARRRGSDMLGVLRKLSGAEQEEGPSYGVRTPNDGDVSCFQKRRSYSHDFLNIFGGEFPVLLREAGERSDKHRPLP